MKETLMTLCFGLLVCGGCAAHDSSDGNSRLTPVELNPESDEPATGVQEVPVTESANLERVTLRFQDSSVPPQYHRSYTIVVETGSVQTTVDVYGAIIARDRRDLDPAEWPALLEDARGLSDELSDADDSATGAPSYALELRRAGTQQTLRWTEHSTPNSAQATSFAHQIEALVPNLQSLRETDYPP